MAASFSSKLPSAPGQWRSSATWCSWEKINGHDVFRAPDGQSRGREEGRKQGVTIEGGGPAGPLLVVVDGKFSHSVGFEKVKHKKLEAPLIRVIDPRREVQDDAVEASRDK